MDIRKGNQSDRAGSTTAKHNSSTTQLYRHFDAHGNLLYVGVSLSMMARLLDHRSRSSWHKDIAAVSVENHPSRSAAIRAEALAIKNEHPIYNKVHNARPGKKRIRPTGLHTVLPDPRRHMATFGDSYPSFRVPVIGGVL